MRLMTGITELLPQWELLLNQIGIPFEIIKRDIDLTIDQYTAIIVSSYQDGNLKERLLTYLEQGGSLLCEADIAEWLLGIKTYPSYVKFINLNEDSPFQKIIPGFIEKSLILPRQATALFSNLGRKLIQIKQKESGIAIILPGGLTKTMLNVQVTRRNFPASDHLFPSERISRQSKHTIRSIVQSVLEYVHITREIPFVFLWPFPDGQKTIFNFRIDTDFASKEKIDKLYDLCNTYNISATWFVDTASTKSWIGHFGTLKNQEIGLHGHRHKIWRQFLKNERDIKKGMDILLKGKISPKGYAAPFGLWNIPLAKAIEHHGFIYSSEFTLNFDDLPFYPFLDNRFSFVLQIPIHPISTARLRNARYTTEEMKKYFKNLLKRCLKYQLPFFIYDHPSTTHLGVIEFIFKLFQKYNLKTMTLLNYAEWWKCRLNAKLQLSYENTIRIEKTNKIDPSLRLCIISQPNKMGLVPIHKIIDLKNISWNNLETEKNEKIAQMDQWNYKMILNDILYYYWRWIK